MFCHCIRSKKQIQKRGKQQKNNNKNLTKQHNTQSKFKEKLPAFMASL